MNWTEDDYMDPEQEREVEAREECARRGLDPDDDAADGVAVWMVVDKEMRERRAAPRTGAGQMSDLVKGLRYRAAARDDGLATEAADRIEALEAALRAVELNAYLPPQTIKLIRAALDQSSPPKAGKKRRTA